jgi:hypothetical protein
VILNRGLLVACGEEAVRDGLEAFAEQAFTQHRPDRVLLPGGCWWLGQAAEASASRLKRAAMNRSSAVEASTPLVTKRSASRGGRCSYRVSSS